MMLKHIKWFFLREKMRKKRSFPHWIQPKYFSRFFQEHTNIVYIHIYMHILFCFSEIRIIFYTSETSSYSILYFLHISTSEIFVQNYLSVFNQHNSIICINYNLISYLKNTWIINISVIYIRTFSWQYVSPWLINWLGLWCLVSVLKESIIFSNLYIKPSQLPRSLFFNKRTTEHQIVPSFTHL